MRSILHKIRSIIVCDKPLYKYKGTLEAHKLIDEAICVAYRGKPIPKGIHRLLAKQDKLGKVCAIFFYGRSGSFFLQSFFDQYNHPEVLTVHPAALAWLEHAVTAQDIEDFNSGVLPPGPLLVQWHEKIMRNISLMYTKLPSQPGLDELCAPREIYSKLVYAQLMLIEPGNMSYDALLKIFFLAYRLSRGDALACDKPLIFLWQAHSPTRARRQWIKKAFPGSHLLMMVRFPEKSLDSHLVHHSYETLSQPLHTLFRRLAIDHMTIDSELIDFPEDNREKAVRFEDLHHHTEYVLRALCRWLDVPYAPELCSSSLDVYVMGAKISGARTLTRSEFQPKLLSPTDCLKIRFLLQEQYRQWGYEALCEPSLEASVESCHALSAAPVFDAQATIAEISQTTPEELAEEADRIKKGFELQRKRRDEGIHIIPLLYPLTDLAGPLLK